MQLQIHVESNLVLNKIVFWGGYRLEPDYYEFWQGRPNRLHDRLSYEKQQDVWMLKRLMP